MDFFQHSSKNIFVYVPHLLTLGFGQSCQQWDTVLKVRQYVCFIKLHHCFCWYKAADSAQCYRLEIYLFVLNPEMFSKIEPTIQCDSEDFQ